MRLEEVFCPLRRSNYCFEEICPFWFKHSLGLSGCILEIVIWASVKAKALSDDSKQENKENIREQELPCVGMEFNGEKVDVVIQDYSRIMEITDRLRRCKSMAELKRFEGEEVWNNLPGIMVVK